MAIWIFFTLGFFFTYLPLSLDREHGHGIYGRTLGICRTTSGAGAFLSLVQFILHFRSIRIPGWVDMTFSIGVGLCALTLLLILDVKSDPVSALIKFLHFLIAAFVVAHFVG